MRSRVNLDRPRRIEYRFVDGQQRRFVEQFVDALQQFVERQFEFLGLLVQFLQLIEFQFIEFLQFIELLQFIEFLQLRVGGFRFRLVRGLRAEYETLSAGRPQRRRRTRAPPDLSRGTKPTLGPRWSRALPKEKLLLRNFQSPGDIVMLTAAVRDIHACYPGRFLTDVRTSCPDLWNHNPNLTPLRDDDSALRVVDCQYPLIHRSNTAPYHFIHGFIEHLNEILGLQIKPTLFRGDLHISPGERRWFEGVIAKKGKPPRFWMFASGGKFDYTIKWWDVKRYQKVIDHFAGQLDFVQIGESQHHQPPLRGVIDLRGQTTLRQLVRLMYHAEGAVSAVSLLMHLAAAVPVRPGMPLNRACVVVAGGREPPHFTCYPHHQYLHTVGALLCCDNGGCWKSRTLALGDGDPKDKELCLDVVGALPRCMDMITARDVIRGIERYYEGGALKALETRRPRR